MNLQEAKKLYIKAKDAYYNSGKPIITDAQFDKLENWIAKKDPTWPELHKTGILPTEIIGKKTKVKLPFFMPSLNKFYPEEVDKLWKKLPVVSEYVYMAKLDGCSVLLEYKNGKPTKLTTRGDGEIGQDISFFIPYTNLPDISNKSYHAFRCEAIFKKDVFQSKWVKEFDNARNAVSGILNRMTAHPAIHDISFMVLGEYGCRLLESLERAKSYGLDVVSYSLYQGHEEKEIYKIAKSADEFEADGIVISTPNFMYSYDSSEKPKSGIFAYKENPDEIAKESEVVQIIWQTSAFGRLIPKVEIKPVRLQNATIKYVTCNNAVWMKDRKIGPGAIVKIVRSGDVIPKIIGVVKPANQSQLPDCEFYEKGVHFYQKENSEEIYVKRLERAINAFKIPEVKYNTLLEIYRKYALYFKGPEPLIDLIAYIKEARASTWLRLTFGNKAGLIIFDNLSKIVSKKHTLIEWLLASCVFDAGIGAKRLSAINKVVPLETLLNKKKEDIIFYISPIDSIGPVLAEQIADGIVKYSSVYTKVVSSYASEQENSVEVVNDIFKGFNFTFTGYRNKDQEYAIQSLGGNVINFSNKTNFLLYDPNGKKSSKIEKAGDRAITWDQLVEEYPKLEDIYNQQKKKKSLF